MLSIMFKLYRVSTLNPHFPRYSYPSQHMRWRVTILNVAKRGGEDSVSVVLAVMWETINEAE